MIAGEYDHIISEPRDYPNYLLFKPFDKLIKQGENMLDLGCGTDHMSIKYANKFKQITAVDHSKEMMAVAIQKSKKMPHIAYVNQDLYSFLEGNKESYDLITIVGCLHHLNPDNFQNLFTVLRGFLKSGGNILIAEPIDIPGIEENAPQEIIDWNAQSVMTQRDYSAKDIEDPDEAPINKAHMLNAIKLAGLSVAEESRGWEIFPHKLPVSFFEKRKLRKLHEKYGESGYIYAAILQSTK